MSESVSSIQAGHKRAVVINSTVPYSGDSYKKAPLGYFIDRLSEPGASLDVKNGLRIFVKTSLEQHAFGMLKPSPTSPKYRFDRSYIEFDGLETILSCFEAHKANKGELVFVAV